MKNNKKEKNAEEKLSMVIFLQYLSFYEKLYLWSSDDKEVKGMFDSEPKSNYIDA